MEDPFNFQALRIHQPGKLLPNRANYEIFNADRQLLATATETEGHTRLKLLGKSVPDTRVLAVTTAAGEPVGFLIKQSSEWITELRGPGGERSAGSAPEAPGAPTPCSAIRTRPWAR